MQYRVAFRINGRPYFSEWFDTTGEAMQFVKDAEVDGLFVTAIWDSEYNII